MASATSAASQQLTYRVLSLFRAPAAADHVAVLLVDDRSARIINSDTGYPITFEQHADALRPVLCAGPAALFIDITFRGVRGTAAPGADPGTVIDPLIERLRTRPGRDDAYCRLPAARRFHPVGAPRIMTARIRSHPADRCDPFFTPPPGPDCRAGRVIDRLKEAADPVSVGNVRADGTYLLADSAPDAAPGSPLEASPALAMVLKFCEAAKGTPRENLPGCRDVAALEALRNPLLPETARALVPVWSFYRTQNRVADKAQFSPASRDPSTQRRECPAVQDNVGADIWTRLGLASYEVWQSLFHFARGEVDTVFGPTACIPSDTLTLRDVQQMANYCGESGNLCEERLATFFAGRMVFYGTDITGINDLVDTPVVGRVPGVAYHAAVAENLLSMGAAYSHTSAAVLPWLNWGQVVAVLIFSIVAVLIALLRKLPPLWRPWVACVPLLAWLAGLFSLVLASRAGLPPVPVALGAICLLALLGGLATYVLAAGNAEGGDAHALPWAIARAGHLGAGLLVAIPAALGLALLAHTQLQLPPVDMLSAAIFAAALAFDE